jgi:hypothetical protein
VVGVAGFESTASSSRKMFMYAPDLRRTPNVLFRALVSIGLRWWPVGVETIVSPDFLHDARRSLLLDGVPQSLTVAAVQVRSLLPGSVTARR